MRRIFVVFLVIGFLTPSFSLAAEFTGEAPATDQILIHFFLDDSGGILGIVPLTDDIFLWAYAPNPHAATTTYPTAYFNTDGSKQTEHIFVNGVPAATVEKVGVNPVQIFWNHQDHLRSTTIVTDSSAAIAESVEYYAFGSIRTNTGAHKEQRKYTGHEFDILSKYTYAQSRYLDTKIGRFLSEDAAFLALGSSQLSRNLRQSAFAGGYISARVSGASDKQAALEAILRDPQALNSYSYARNNPLKYIDRSGEEFLSATAIGILLVASFVYNFLDLAIAGYKLKVTNPEQFNKVAAEGGIKLGITVGTSAAGLTPIQQIGLSVLDATLTLIGGSAPSQPSVSIESKITPQTTIIGNSNQFTGLGDLSYQQSLQNISAQLQAIQSLIATITAQVNAIQYQQYIYIQ